MDLTSYPVSARLSASLGWAAAEYDELGQDEFLARYGFGRARAYLPIIDDKTYDSKAVLGAVYKHATGRPLGPEDFSGGAVGAARVLRALGLEVATCET